jgi:hypothetical protein
MGSNPPLATQSGRRSALAGPTRSNGWPRANAREPAHPGIEVSFDTPHGRPGLRDRRARALAAQRSRDREEPRSARRRRPLRRHQRPAAASRTTRRSRSAPASPNGRSRSPNGRAHCSPKRSARSWASWVSPTTRRRRRLFAGSCRSLPAAAHDRRSRCSEGFCEGCPSRPDPELRSGVKVAWPPRGPGRDLMRGGQVSACHASKGCPPVPRE